MPQIQVLPAVPTFGSKLSQVLGQAATDIGQGLHQRSNRSQLDALLKEFSPQPNPPSNEQMQGTTPGKPNVAQPKSILDISPIKFTQLYKVAEKALGPEAAKVMVNEFSEERKLEAQRQLQKEKQERSSELSLKEKSLGVERAQTALKEAGEQLKTLDQRRTNNRLIKEAIKQGELGGLDQDYLADVLHFEPLRTAKGAQFRTAAKDLFVKTIQGVGSRPNQWIEQQIDSALVKLGKTPEANLTLSEIVDFQLDTEDQYIKALTELEDRYLKTTGITPGSISTEAHEMIRPFVDLRQQQLAYKLREIHEQEMGDKNIERLKKVPEGTPLTAKMASVLSEMYEKEGNSREEADKKAEETAKRLGYTIPTPDVYMSATP